MPSSMDQLQRIPQRLQHARETENVDANFCHSSVSTVNFAFPRADSRERLKKIDKDHRGFSAPRVNAVWRASISR